MVRQFTAWTLVLGLLSTPAFAQSTIRESANLEAARLAQTQRPASRGRNPNQTASLVLVGAGGSLALLALLVPSSASCEETRTTVSCGTHANKGLLFGGLGAIGLGAFLYMKGEGQRRPFLTPTADGVIGGYRIAF